MSTPQSPSAEVEIDEALVRGLLEDQHPDLAGLPLQPLGNGFDNVMYRLGKAHTLRLPRRAAAAPLVLNEQRCLAALSKRLPLPVPAAVRHGEPGRGYPWTWSVLPWFEGEAADRTPPNANEAPRLAGFLKQLHFPAPEDAPNNDFRGVPLADRRHVTEERLARLRAETHAITEQVESAWQEALAAPLGTETVWVHGDLHARNVLVEDGRLSAIIDWGDITSGDPATDLASFWLLFDAPEARRAGLEAYGASEALAQRARGWAIVLGAVLLDTGRVDNPRHASMGAKTFERVSTD